MSNLFRSSIEFLKSTPIQAVSQSELSLHHRNLAEGLNKKFSSFAVEICGCDNPADRVHLKKAVWHQTVGMRLAKFQKGSTDQLVRVAQMECPVSIFPKSSDESSPSKIILSSKLLRAHFGLNESTTCRGCSKRGRCPFVHKTVSNKNSKTSLGALMKVLFGITQQCRLHLKDPEKYAFVMSAEEVEAAAELTEKLREFLKPSAMERQLRNVPIADRNAVRAIVNKQLKKKEMVENEIKKERKDGMPGWMRESIGEPVLEKVEPENEVKVSKPKFDIDSEDWIPEEKEEEFSQSNLRFGDVQIHSLKSTEPCTSLDTLSDLPIVQRFAKFDQVFTKKNLRREKGETAKSLSSRSPAPVGGYRMESLPIDPAGGIEYIKPQLMKGRTVLDNVSVAGKLWGNVNPWITELKFLQRVPYTDKVPEQERYEDKAFETASENVRRQRGEPSRSEQLENKPDLFNVWKAKRDTPKRVALIDKRFDYNDGCVGSDSFDRWSKAEIVTGVPSGVALCDMDGRVDGKRKEALDAALARTGTLKETDEYIETSSRLRFPKFPPELDKKEEKKNGFGPRSRGGVDITSLMRPRQTK